MADQPVSLTKNVEALEAGAHVVAATFLEGRPTLALADGTLRLGAQTVVPHPEGAILVTASDGGRLFTGGDDGRVVATDGSGASEVLADEKGRWIDALATRSGAVAWSSGKTVHARETSGAVKTWTAPSTPRGLCFLSKGYRLAIAHYNGVSLWFPNAAASPEVLEWKGSHLDATVSSSLRCRRTRCTVGGSATRATCV